MQTVFPPRSPAPVWIAFYLAALSAGLAPAVEPRHLPTIPDDLLILGGRLPDPRRDFQGHVAQVVEDARGDDVARGTHIHPAYLCQGRHLGWAFGVLYPDLKVGDVVPALGHVFEVARTGGGKRPDVLLRKLKGDKVPRGAATSADALAVPMSKDGRGQFFLHGNCTKVETIKPPSKAGEQPHADIAVLVSLPLIDEQMWVYTRARPGDMVLFGRAAHKVLAVVPPDVKTRVIGWVELDPDPIEERELIGRKIPFLRPKRERTTVPAIKAKSSP